MFNHLILFGKTVWTQKLWEKKEKGDTHISEPSFLALITGSDFAYTRNDGVKVIPIACLKD